MAFLPDPLGLFTDGGGGGSGGAAGFDDFLDFLKKEQAKLKELTEREREQAESFAGLRRGELADRTGFAGLITVGEAVQRSDVTLAAEIDLLAEGDPQRQAFQDALSAETAQRAKQTRVITGEQFRAEDALAALQERFDEDTGRSFGRGRPGVEDLTGILTDIESFREEFEFFDVGTLESDVQGRLDELARLEEQRRKRKPKQEEESFDDGSDALGGPGDPGLGTGGGEPGTGF